MSKAQEPKIILGIETSCDETGAAILIKQNGQDRVIILSNIVASSASIQIKYGGVVPEQAAREQFKSIIPVIKESLDQAQVNFKQVDAIAVTYGPGLVGSLLVGVETAKTLSLVWNKPLVAVNHLLAHFYASWIDTRHLPTFPFIGLLVSGGHTDLILMTGHGKYKYLGGTRDDAAGECFDKCARLLNLPYPGGPNLAKLAEKGDPRLIPLPRPMFNSQDFDFSFSGLKTAVAKVIGNINTGDAKERYKESVVENEVPMSCNLASSIEEAITDVLVKKTIAAALKYNIDQIVIAGGVAANSTLQRKFRLSFTKASSRGKMFVPSTKLCTDNAAVVAACAFYNFKLANPLKLQANPNLSLES